MVKPTLYLGCVLFLSAAVCVSSETSRPFIHAGDVVFMYSANPPSLYDDYQCTVSGWGGRSQSREEQAVKSFQARVEEAQRRGIRYCGSVDFLVDFGGFIDFRPDSFTSAISRDLDGNPLRVPWLWDHTHKGQPAYWFCTNNPEYQQYLRDQAERACLAPIDGLHIDDYSGSSACSAYNGGCFCPYCLEGFRDYLRDQFSAERLKEMGIYDIARFDYAEFLREKGWNAERYKKEHHACPLIGEFQKFQNRQMIKRITDVFEHAEKLRGKPLVRSINSSASGNRELIPFPVIDYFCGEVGHHAAAKQAPMEPIFVYKMVEALGRRQTATASGQDWAWIKANDKPGLVRMWIAQTYAFGSVFMAPHNQWCYTSELGTHWWRGKAEDFAYLYQFVRQHHLLLDDRISLADIALIHSRENHGAIRDAALRMAVANIPFAIVVAGNDELPVAIDPHGISGFAHVFVGDKPLGEPHDSVLKSASVHTSQWHGFDQLPDTVKREVQIDGADRICVSLRYHPQHPDAPIVCHLLNQNYDAEKDTILPKDVKITISKRLLQKTGREPTITEVILHQPKAESVGLPVTQAEESISFEVNELGLWAIVEF
ncbi:MAG: hypothetical protein C4527_06700 [Candidatus Omnitrophota bacterium]|jgi:hypothetical protein|nr:MAG: hypothetical protein C4527_06700 [Candidatus Omnitrophota bacterium]